MKSGASNHQMAARVYRTLLVLYPRAFRDEYGPNMVDLFNDQCHDEPTWRVVTRSLTDIAVSVPQRHLEAHMNRPPLSAVSIAYFVVAAAGVGVALVGGSNRTGLLIGAVLAVVATIAGIAALRQASTNRHRSATDHWWAFLVAGPVLIGAVVVAAGLGLNAWFLGMAVVLTAIALLLAGIGLGVAHLVTQRSRRSAV